MHLKWNDFILYNLIKIKNMKTKYFWYFICLLLFCSSCRQYPKEVEFALELAGDNKEELVRVLKHYEDSDEQKFAAACFLISNMPYHKSKTQLELPSCYQRYFKKVDSIIHIDSTAIDNDSLKHALSSEFDSFPPPVELSGKADVRVLTSDYLIDHIELAFEEWRHSPLLKTLSFEEFKEWILPYRTIDESLVDGRRQLRTIIRERIIESGMDDICKPIACYQKVSRLQKKMNAYVTHKQHIGMFDPFIPPFTLDCSNLSMRACNYLRACGVPTVYEFTPQWPDKNSRHYWCASPDSNHVLQGYTPPYTNIKEQRDQNLKYVGKVYQRTFGARKDTPYFLKNKNEKVPAYFDIATIKDVTERYHPCVTLTLALVDDIPNNLAYLSFFNSKSVFVPVAWGKINKRSHSVTFSQVPVNMLFFPSYMSEDGTVHGFGNPFMLRQDSLTGHILQEEVVCDLNRKINLHLLRKYPSKKHLVHARQNLEGACLLASNLRDRDYDTLMIIQAAPIPYWQEYVFMNRNRYRYYRLVSKDKKSIDIAELEFLGKKSSKHKFSTPAKLPVFSAKAKMPEPEFYKIEGTPLNTESHYLSSFDGTPYTYASWEDCVVDFKYPVCISRIRLFPRTAMNIIESGHRYQLLYFRDGKWVEYETLVAKYNYLDIDSIPAETIYWLRNLDKGKEELPFFYKDGNQVFINQNIK